MALAGCFGSGSSDQRSPPRAGAGIGTEVRSVDCSDWRDAGPRERSGIIRQVRKFAGGPTGSPAGRGAVLEDDRAYALFERQCAPRFARGFKLYKLYTRAAAFGGR